MNITQRTILHLLSEEPMGRAHLEAKTGMSSFGVNKNLRELLQMRLIRVDRMEVASKRGSGAKRPIFATFTKWPLPEGAAIGDKKRERSAYAKIVSALRELGPMTTAEIAEATDMTEKAVDTRLSYWRSGENKGKHFRISGYVYQLGQGGGWRRVFSTGTAPDARKPPRDQKQVVERYAKKRREEILAKRAAREFRAEGAAVKVSPFDQMLRVTGATRGRVLEVA